MPDSGSHAVLAASSEREDDAPHSEPDLAAAQSRNGSHAADMRGVGGGSSASLGSSAERPLEAAEPGGREQHQPLGAGPPKQPGQPGLGAEANGATGNVGRHEGAEDAEEAGDAAQNDSRQQLQGRAKGSPVRNLSIHSTV